MCKIATSFSLLAQEIEYAGVFMLIPSLSLSLYRDHLDIVKVVPFSLRAKNTLAYHLTLLPLTVPLRIPPLHAGTFRSNLAPRS